MMVAPQIWTLNVRVRAYQLGQWFDRESLVPHWMGKGSDLYPAYFKYMFR